MKALVLLPCLALCLLPIAAHAQRGRDLVGVPDRDTVEAINEVNGERVELLRKLERALAERTEAITDAERRGKLPPGRAAGALRALAESQNAWQTYRRQQCGFVAALYGHRAKSLRDRQKGLWDYEKRLIEQRIDQLGDDLDPF